jgi:hypothetical protein
MRVPFPKEGRWQIPIAEPAVASYLRKRRVRISFAMQDRA